jgi:hypothetical protein
VIDTLAFLLGGVPDESIDVIPFGEEKLSEVRTVLAGDATDDCRSRIHYT